MNLKEQLKQIIENTSLNPLLSRTYQKEVLQDYILAYIYNSEYKTLIFTGGTCLRKVYGLNRLSEDLDFDYVDNFDIKSFSENLISYFKKTQNINQIEYKIAENQQTVFIKMPLNQITGIENKFEQVLFVRCDVSKEKVGKYITEINSIKSGNFEFLIKSYDLSTLFANKIGAFLQRDYYRGADQTIAFKGRDVYDMYWLLNMSAQTQFKIKPNIERLKSILNIDKTETISEMIKSKIKIIDKKYMYDDLLPLVESPEYLKSIVDESDKAIINKIDFVLG